MTDNGVDIVIPAFDQPEFTTVCLQSLAQFAPCDQIRVILVNNGSKEESREIYAKVLSEMPYRSALIDLPANTGFVRATNVGIAVSDAPYLMFLNNDTTMTDGVIEKLVAVLEKEPKVGIVGPRSSAQGQWQGRYEEMPGYMILNEKAMLSFFCALLRREIISQCGYLSEEYKAGFGDDDDLCEAIKKHGWKLAFRTDALVIHHHRTTFREVYGDQGIAAMQMENLARFKKKWGR